MLLSMPSAPSRLAAVLACVIALGPAAPALADNGPGGKTPPPPLPGLQSPGQQLPHSAAPCAAPRSSPPSRHRPPAAPTTPASRRRSNKGKGNAGGPVVSPNSRHNGNGGHSNFTYKQDKGKTSESAPQTTTTTTTTSAGSVTSPSSSSTPAGGSSPTPLPSTP